MSWFHKKKKENSMAVQTAAGEIYSHPFGYIRNYAPLGHCEKQLYRSLRESVPVIDSAIYKIVRLVGGFEVKCRDTRAQRIVDSFIRNA